MSAYFVYCVLMNIDCNNQTHALITNYPNVTTKECGITQQLQHSVDNPCFKWHSNVDALSSVISGRDAHPGEMPYVANVDIYRKPSYWNRRQWYRTFCTGTILNEWFILTAGHCVKCDGCYQVDFTIYPGVTFVDKKGTGYPSDIVIIHQSLQKGESYDLALIKLKSPLTLRPPNAPANYQGPNSICLPKGDTYNYQEQYGMFAGYGFTSLNPNVSPKILQMGWVRILPTMNNLTDYSGELILSTRYSAFICPGDSGGPLVQFVNGRAVLIGIVYGHTGGNCVDAEFSVFVRVSLEIDWITNQVLKNTD